MQKVYARNKKRTCKKIAAHTWMFCRGRQSIGLSPVYVPVFFCRMPLQSARFSDDMLSVVILKTYRLLVWLVQVLTFLSAIIHQLVDSPFDIVD